MFRKQVFFFCILLIFTHDTILAQDDGFCNAMNAILRDAPNKFRNIRGKKLEANANATFWEAGIKVPGTIKSRFVASMGLFYEGALLQSKYLNAVPAAYNKYKQALTECLGKQGYKMTEQKNFYPGLQSFGKLVFMMNMKEDALPENPPPHVTLEATYSRDLGIYTVVVYIFEH